jgi:hypothetical protein
LGRGRIVFQSSATRKLLFVAKAGLRVSLSLGERAGVRGKRVVESQLISGFNRFVSMLLVRLKEEIGESHQ